MKKSAYHERITQRLQPDGAWRIEATDPLTGARVWYLVLTARHLQGDDRAIHCLLHAAWMSAVTGAGSASFLAMLPSTYPLEAGGSLMQRYVPN